MKKNWLLMIGAAMLSLVMVTGCGMTDNIDNDMIEDVIPGEGPLDRDIDQDRDMNDPGNDFKDEDNNDRDMNDRNNNRDGMNDESDNTNR